MMPSMIMYVVQFFSLLQVTYLIGPCNLDFEKLCLVRLAKPFKLIHHHIVPKTKDIREIILLSNFFQSDLPNQELIHHLVALKTKGIR